MYPRVSDGSMMIRSTGPREAPFPPTEDIRLRLMDKERYRIQDSTSPTLSSFPNHRQDGNGLDFSRNGDYFSEAAVPLHARSLRLAR